MPRRDEMLRDAAKRVRELDELSDGAAKVAKEGETVIASRDEDGAVTVRVLTDAEITAVEAAKPVEKKDP